MTESAAASKSISGRLAVSVLEWLIGSSKLDANSSLCMVRVVPGLDDESLPDEVVLSTGRRWRLVHVNGDFDLRMKLVEAADTPLFAFITYDKETSHTPTLDRSIYSADLLERTALRYIIRPLARHTFSALIGSDASALDDDRFSSALRDVLTGGRRAELLAAIRRRTWGKVVRESDATSILCEAAFGFDDRYVESRPGELLERWLREPPLLTSSLYGFAIAILRQRYPLYADLLESTPDRSPEMAFRAAARHDRRQDATFVSLARDAGRSLRKSAPARLEVLLREAEDAYVAAGSPPTDALLLRTAYQTRIRTLVRRAAYDTPPSTDEISDLSAFLYFDSGFSEALIALARAGRGLHALDQAELPSTLASDAQMFRDQLAWLDRAVRRLREAHFDDSESDAVATQLINRWYALRDSWNAAFAKRLASAWPTLFAKPGEGQPLVVSHVLKHIVRPLLASSEHVFLVVLDGCDLPTFLEIVTALNGAGVPVPTIDVMLSAVPTVTSHARRAIFAGKIPKDGVRPDDSDDPSGDRKAFEGPNSILEGYSRKLYLKGDLGDEGAALAAALGKKESQLIAAVFNDVDDAIASKEFGVLAERTIERCTKAFRGAMFAAVDAGWQIVLTADHGHTPYRSPDLKLSLAHPRYAELGPKESAPAGTVLFEIVTGAPYRIAAAYQLGAHSGPQHVGYHGGVSLEEMFVPLAIYVPNDQSGTALRPPSWWDDAPAIVPPPLRKSYSESPTSNGSVSQPTPLFQSAQENVRDRCRAVLADDAKLLEIFERIALAGTLDATQLGRAVSLPAGRVRPNVIGLRNKLESAGIEPPFSIDEDPLVIRWVGAH